jgi:hypothetical protein
MHQTYPVRHAAVHQLLLLLLLLVHELHCLLLAFAGHLVPGEPWLQSWPSEVTSSGRSQIVMSSRTDNLVYVVYGRKTSTAYSELCI